MNYDLWKYSHYQSLEELRKYFFDLVEQNFSTNTSPTDLDRVLFDLMMFQGSTGELDRYYDEDEIDLIDKSKDNGKLLQEYGSQESTKNEKLYRRGRRVRK